MEVPQRGTHEWVAAPELNAGVAWEGTRCSSSAFCSMEQGERCEKHPARALSARHT